ncbi:MAG: sensor histidine kinase [Cyanobacteria bacterium P01_A01_bin.17]
MFAIMLRRAPLSRHPFRLLLYLEWILVAIATLAILSPLPSRPSNRPRPAAQIRVVTAPSTERAQSPPIPERPFRRYRRNYPRYPIAAVTSIGILGLLGLRLPTGSTRLPQGLYTLLGLELSWLAVLLGSHAQTAFPPLLLVVVIRACLMFRWRGRIIVTLLAYISFLVMLGLAVARIHFLGVPLTRLLHRERFRLQPDFLDAVVLNSSLLFGFVLIFVTLLVSALLTAKQSQDNLTQANERLRRYTLLIENQATLQERQRIAREMHDSVGHSLTAQSIQLENVDLWMPQNQAKALDHLQKARQLGKNALQDVRQSVASLRVDPLQNRTLTQALQQLTQAFEQNTGIKMIAQIAETATLPKEFANALFRLTQEALTNVSKHSQATEVQLHFREQNADYQLQVTDNGQGFDPTQHTVGFGLQSMQERTEALGGTFTLHSQPQQGCQIQAIIPRGIQ